MVDLESGLGLGTKIALASTLAKTQHTISEIGSNPLETNEAGETVVKGEGDDFFITNVHQYFIQAVAVFGGATALITMVLLEGQLIDIASLGTMLLAPLVFWQKMQLNKLGGMRKQQNELRHSVNRFTVENNKLQEANTQLEKEVDGLKDVEDRLGEVAVTAGGQVHKLVAIVNKNGELLKQIDDLLQNQVAQSIMTAIIQTDHDGDFTLNPMEVTELIWKLHTIPGVHFDEEKFRHFLASDEDELTLTDLAGLVHNLKDETIPPEDKIFNFEPKDILEEVPDPDA